MVGSRTIRGRSLRAGRGRTGRRRAGRGRLGGGRHVVRAPVPGSGQHEDQRKKLDQPWRRDAARERAGRHESGGAGTERQPVPSGSAERRVDQHADRERECDPGERFRAEPEQQEPDSGRAAEQRQVAREQRPGRVELLGVATEHGNRRADEEDP